MENLKEQLIIETVEIDSQKYSRLNLSIKEICYRVGVAGFAVFKKLQEMGIELPAPILVSQQDVDDYNNYEKTHQNFVPMSEMTPEYEFELDTINLIANSAYFDREFVSADGKVGLIDSLGNIVVPPIFDSAEGTEYLFHANNKAIVGKDGKLWLTPRDGTGHIVNITQGYDNVTPKFQLPFVERAGKHGLVDLTTGKELIPSEMDWIKQVVNDYVFGKNGKLGYYSMLAYKEVKYLAPVYDAFDLTSRQFKRDEQWGWLLTDGTFTTETPCLGESSIFITWHPECYIDKDPKEEEKYLSLDDLKKKLKALEKNALKERNRTLASRLDLPTLNFQRGFKAADEIEKPLQDELAFCIKNTIWNKTFYFGMFNEDKPLIYIKFTNIGKGITMNLEWTDSELEDQWRDLKLPEKIMRSLHVIISASEERPILTFQRQFKANQLKKLAKFLTYYLLEFRGIEKEKLRAYNH